MNRLKVKPHFGRYRIYLNGLTIAECSSFPNARLIVQALKEHLIRDWGELE